MTEIFSIIAAVCAALSLILSGFILKNQKNNGTYHQNQDNSRLEQMLERTNYIAEQTARTSQDYMDFMSKQQSANLKGIQENWKRSTQIPSAGSPRSSEWSQAKSST